MAQIYPPPFDRRVGLGMTLDGGQAGVRKYPGVVRVSLLLGVLAMSWTGVFVCAVMASHLVRHFLR